MKKDWMVWLAAALLFGSGIVWGLAWSELEIDIPLLLRRVGSSRVAVWVQAIGSIIAIIAAFKIANLGEKRRQQVQHIDAVIRLNNVLAISKSAMTELNDVIRRATAFKDRDLRSDDTLKSDILVGLSIKIDRKVRELQTIDVVSLPSHDFADSFLAFRSSVEITINLVDACLEPPVSQKLRALSDWSKEPAQYVGLMEKSIDKYFEQHRVKRYGS